MIATRPFHTLEDYEAVEQGSDSKFEFVNGVIVAMAGGTAEHGRLSLSIGAELRSALKGSDCSAFSSDVRIGHADSSFRAYPDASVVCGEIEYAERPSHTVVNPVCIVEVLSEGTAAYDQGDKLKGYERIPSVRSIVFVSQEGRAITVHRRTADGFEEQSYGAGQSFELPGIPRAIAVDDVYE